MIDSSTVVWEPLADVSGAHHVLGAGACFVHPGNGNQYFWDCVQYDGARQNLHIYRLVAKTNVFERLVTFEGMKDSQRGFERGGCVIVQGVAQIIATTMIPKGVAYATETGYQGMRCRIPGVDDPWSAGTDPRYDALASQLGALGQRITAIETALGNVVSGGLEAADREALDRLRALLRIN